MRGSLNGKTRGDKPLIRLAAASRQRSTFSHKGRREECTARLLLPVPPTLSQPLAHMLRRRCCHAHRLLVLRNRNHDLAGMQMQDRLAEARAVAINVVADDRPARG